MANPDTLKRIDDFGKRTRAALFVRQADNLVMIRPDKTMGINQTATEILTALYNRDSRPAGRILDELAPRLGVAPELLLNDTENLIQAVGAILNEDYSPRRGLTFGHFDRQMVAFPTLAEIALTYGCQNRCLFCYASSPHREGEHKLMTTPEVKRVMDKIFHEAHVPSLSFTGGESTLRPDLAELIRYGHNLGLRINLISNAIRLADFEYAQSLVAAGLDSAQVSLEAADPAVHDKIVGKAGAYAKTIAGISNLQRLGIHVHTNTTLCAQNLGTAEELISFAVNRLKLKTLSMNMVIRTGQALDDNNVGVTYRQVADRLPDLIARAASEGIRLVWYSPIPYCIFNPVLHGLGAKSCACVDGILSIDPAGQVLPCSSFQNGIGSLLDKPFSKIFSSRQAAYWRKKKFLPPVCCDCPDGDVCGGGCPLYWDAAGSFEEIPMQNSADFRSRQKWENRRKHSKSFGVRAPGSVEK
ncbi:MAG: radical SAM protein [Deltaproteobacteria bacterium]|nr:radical SAM protein [Deltaproteobacteria bacterium]